MNGQNHSSQSSLLSHLQLLPLNSIQLLNATMFSHYINQVIVGALFATATIATPCCPGRYTTHKHHEKVMNNYFDVWAGNISLVESTFAPVLTLQGDRFPTGAHGSIQLSPLVNSSAAFTSFVENTRSGFDDYHFKIQKWVGNGVNIVIRWTLEGKIGRNFKVVPT